MKNSLDIFAIQSYTILGAAYVPIPGGMGISDYLMFDGFDGMMGEQMALNVELISRGITFYVCVTASGIFTLIGYFWGKHKS